MKNFEKNRHVLPSYKAAKKTNKRTPVPLPECLCMDPLYAPIYQCDSGHNMCAKCTKESPVCPICRKSTGAMRNWQLEEIITYYRGKLKDVMEHFKDCHAENCTVMKWLTRINI